MIHYVQIVFVAMTTSTTTLSEKNKKIEQCSSSAGTTAKKASTRKVFSHSTQVELETAFRISPYLTAWKRQCLSQKLGLTERQVRVWFQNRRMRIKSEQRHQRRLSGSKSNKSNNSSNGSSSNSNSPIANHSYRTKASPPPDYATAIATSGYNTLDTANYTSSLVLPQMQQQPTFTYSDGARFTNDLLFPSCVSQTPLTSSYNTVFTSTKNIDSTSINGIWANKMWILNSY